jgi:hypothetical protein
MYLSTFDIRQEEIIEFWNTILSLFCAKKSYKIATIPLNHGIPE